jgi:hypothetical protein
MRRLFAAAVLVAALFVAMVVGSSATAEDPAGAPPPASQEAAPQHTAAPKCPSVRAHGRYARRASRFTHAGGDYRAGRWHPKMVRKLRAMRVCQRRAGHTRMYWTMRRAYKHRVANWKFHRYIDRITPYGEWAIPGSIVMCESGGNYRKWNYGGSGASGAYQAMHGTWIAYGGGRWASDAAYAPPYAQHIVAGRIWRGQGRGAWEC